MSEQMVKGPWCVLDGYKHIGSDDFALDVCLAIDGDFADAAQLAAYAQELCDKLNDAAALRASRDEMAKALETIERWTDFPPTGKTWPEGGTPMSYGAAFGSNGERDYMRAIARAALARAGA
jgi:hypothetical protein